MDNPPVIGLAGPQFLWSLAMLSSFSSVSDKGWSSCCKSVLSCQLFWLNHHSCISTCLPSFSLSSTQRNVFLFLNLCLFSLRILQSLFNTNFTKRYSTSTVLSFLMFFKSLYLEVYSSLLLKFLCQNLIHPWAPAKSKAFFLNGL